MPFSIIGRHPDRTVVLIELNLIDDAIPIISAIKNGISTRRGKYLLQRKAEVWKQARVVPVLSAYRTRT